MKNKGQSQHRFKDNPLEKKFALAWEKDNNQCRALEYLLAKNSNHPDGEVTARDRKVAATVVQWLGSPVGESFVREVLKSHE
jgi:hypothetical protein